MVSHHWRNVFLVPLEFCNRNYIKDNLKPSCILIEDEYNFDERRIARLKNMNRDELVSQIRFLLKLQEDKDAIIDRQQESLDEMKADLKEARKDNKALQKQLAESSKKLDAALASIEELRRQLTDMVNRNDLNNQHRLEREARRDICKSSATEKIKKQSIA